MQEDTGLIPVSGRSLEVANGNPLQSSCLENPVDRGAWWATAHGVTKSWTQWSTEQRGKRNCRHSLAVKTHHQQGPPPCTAADSVQRQAAAGWEGSLREDGHMCMYG